MADADSTHGDDVVAVQTEGYVGRITLDRPAAMNTFSTDLAADLDAALHAHEADAGVRAVVISGAFAGVAGGLHTIHAQYVAVGSLFWITSGDIVIITVLGGIGSIFGPVAGTVAFLYVENIVSGEIAFWLLVLGALFVTVVWLFPAGIWGIVTGIRSTVREQILGDDS